MCLLKNAQSKYWFASKEYVNAIRYAESHSNRWFSAAKIRPCILLDECSLSLSTKEGGPDGILLPSEFLVVYILWLLLTLCFSYALLSDFGSIHTEEPEQQTYNPRIEGISCINKFNLVARRLLITLKGGLFRSNQKLWLEPQRLSLMIFLGTPKSTWLHLMKTTDKASWKLPYNGKVWWGECLANLLFSSVWWNQVWRMNRSAKRLLIVTTTMDGFSLANRRWSTKFMPNFLPITLYNNFKWEYEVHLDPRTAYQHCHELQ